MTRFSLGLVRGASCYALALLAGCNDDARRVQPGRPSESVVVSSANEVGLLVTLDRNGVVEASGQMLYLDDDIVAAFDTFRKRSPRGKLIILAHPATLHGRLVRIVDLAKQAHAPYEVILKEAE